MAQIREWSRNAGYLPIVDVIKYFQTIYDKDGNGIVDDAEKVNGLTVNTAVPFNAIFTDTTYSIQDGELSQWNFTTAFRDKLNGIEAGATADQTGAEIKALYEAELDTNAYTDAEKLKLSYITVTQLVNLDAIETKLDLLTVTQAINLDHITVTQPVDLDAIETRVNQLDASIVLKGVWDASLGTFPTSTLPGESWIVSVAGTVDGVAFNVNDRVVALIAAASATIYNGNWHKLDYTDEVLSVDGRTGAITLSDLYEPKDATILKDADIGVNVQSYNANTVIEDRTVTAEDNAIDFGGVTKNYELTATAANITAANITAKKEGTIIVHSAENITGWGVEFKFKTVPTDLLGTEIFSYFIEDATNIWIGRVQ